MKTLKSELVQQIVSFREVGTELRNRIDTLNNLGYSIKNVIETSVNNVHNKQGFIIVYECDAPDECECHEDKWALKEINFTFDTRDQAEAFIIKLQATIAELGHITVKQVYVLYSNMIKFPIRFDETKDYYLIGWTELSDIVPVEELSDSTCETFLPRHYCTVTLPAPKYLVEEENNG